MTAYLTLDTALWVTSVLVILVGLFNYKTLNSALRVLFYLMILSLCIDVIANEMIQCHYHTIWLLNLYTIIEFIFFAAFFLLSIRNQLQLRIGLIGYSAILIVLIIVTASPNFHIQLNSVSMGIESITLICSSVFYFRTMLKELEYITPWSNPSFWVNSGALFYFSGAFFVFIFSDYHGLGEAIHIWDIHTFILIFFKLLIAIAFWKSRKT